MGGFFFWNRDREYATGIAERRSVTLKDGSVIHLDSFTRLFVRQTKWAREVRLVSGRAVFDVAPDPERPFEVAAEQGFIRVLGTVFEVNLISSEQSSVMAKRTGLLEVRVEEGSVGIGIKGMDSEDAPVNLKAGDMVSRRVGERDLEVSRFEVSEFGDWRSGRLVYRARPLKYVLADLQREYGGEIIVVDRSLGDLPVSGTLRTYDLDEAFAVLITILPITLEQFDGGVLIRRKTFIEQ
ncbi:MAG: FecR domain-containing protein [Verrucomicrobiota bacterium]